MQLARFGGQVTFAWASDAGVQLGWFKPSAQLPLQLSPAQALGASQDPWLVASPRGVILYRQVNHFLNGRVCQAGFVGDERWVGEVDATTSGGEMSGYSTPAGINLGWYSEQVGRAAPTGCY